MTKAVTLGDLVARGALSIGDGHRAKLEELAGYGPLFLRAGALSEAGFDWDGLDAFASTKGLEKKLGCAEDVVITTKGNSIGRVGYVPADAPAFVYSPHLSYWRSVDRSVVSPRYLYYWAKSADFEEQLRAFGFGTDMAPYLSLRDQSRLTISLPEQEQQEAIAEVLGALDDKIGANDRVIGVCEQLMVSLAGSALSSTPVANLATQSARAIPPRLFDTEVAHYSIPAFDAGVMPESSQRGVIKSNKFLLTDPLVLVSKLNPRIPRVWDVNVLPRAMAVASTEFVALVPKEVSTSELWASLSQSSALAELRNMVSGTSGSHQRVKPAEILGLSVPDPRSLGDKSRAAIASLGEAVHTCRLECRQLAATRDELLPLLMSGRVRVRDAEKVVGALSDGQ